MNSKRISALVVTVLLTAAAMFTLAGPASAHVTVNSTGAKQGGYAVLTFRVPNESASASTTKLQVQLPAEAPISSVLVEPRPGWTYKITKARLDTPITTGHGDQITEVVREIDWTADGAADAIKPGEFAEFRISAGPLPKVDVLRFGALQTYSDGSVVAWNEQPAPGSSAAPEHPKPALTLAATAADPHAAGTPAAAGSDSGGDSGGDTVALVLSIVALGLAVSALGLSALRRKGAAH